MSFKGESNNESLQLVMLDSFGGDGGGGEETQSYISQEELSNFRVVHNYSLTKVPEDGDSQSNSNTTTTSASSSSTSSSSSETVTSVTAPPGGFLEESLSKTSSDSGSGITTLELHPNVILGLTDNDDSVSNETDSDTRHSCSICHASYKTRANLKRHMRLHMRSKAYGPCTECGKGFSRQEHLRKHMEVVHGSVSKQSCPYCDREISRADHLKRHIASFHRDGKCRKSSKDKAAVLKVHLANGLKRKAQLSFLTPSFDVGTAGQTLITPIPAVSELSQSPEEDSGPNCNGNNGSAPSMTIIPSNILGPGQGVATLAIQSTSTQKVLVHQRLPSGAKIDLSTATNSLAGLANLSLSLGQNVAAVSSANSSVDSESSVSSKSINNEGVRVIQIFNCGECSASFQTEQELVAHSKLHKPQAHHKCPECPRSYTRRERLNEHIRCFHKGEKFKCDYCEKSLSRKDHVLRHIRSIHPEIYAANFAGLDETNVTFDEKGRLVSASLECFTPQEKKQRLPRTLKVPPSIGDVGVLLRSVCPECLKVFGTSYHLTRHMESCHNGDSRPFKCSGCDKMFKRKDHLTKHVKVHCPNLKGTPQTVRPLTEEDQTKEISSAGNESYHPQETSHLSTKEATECSTTTETSQVLPEQTQLQNSKAVEQVDNGNVGNLRLLADESMSSSDCTHMILHNLQVELDDNNPVDDTTTTTLRDHESIVSSAQIPHSQSQVHPKMSGNNEFSVAVIDSFMQGNVNVVVVDDEISSFLQHSSASHMTATFPCGQCQKEFSARDLLIAHLQEHDHDSSIHGDHDQRISDISFSDF